MSTDDTPGGGSDGRSTLQNGAAALTASPTYRGGFPLPSMWFSSS